MSHYDLYAIGNALVDSEYEVSDAQLQALGVEKRHMTLIDAERRAFLLAGVHGLHSRRTGGGSAGNTTVALAQLGGKAFYSCRVADDELGAFYHQDLLANGVATNLSHTAFPEGQTGICMVMVTPDAERSMSTFLGATADIDHTALQARDIAKSKVYYMEGYLSASPTGLDAALKGRAIAKEAGVKLATNIPSMSHRRWRPRGSRSSARRAARITRICSTNSFASSSPPLRRPRTQRDRLAVCRWPSHFPPHRLTLPRRQAILRWCVGS